MVCQGENRKMITEENIKLNRFEVETVLKCTGESLQKASEYAQNLQTRLRNLSLDLEIERWFAEENEAGHAAVAEALFPGSVTLVSAFSRDGENGGFTSRCHSVGDYDTKMAVYGDIYISLGGLAATEQHFGVTDLGSSEDLDRAFDRVMDIIGDNGVCGFHLHNFGYDASQENTLKREQAASSEVERLYRRTKEILAANRDLLDAIARGLAEKGVLDASDIARIKADCGAPLRLPLAV